MNRSSLATTRCTVCGRSVPITRARRLRAHYTVPGGQLECAASRGAVVFRPVPLSTSSAPAPARPPAAPTRWAGPRRWEDADF